MGDTLNPLFLFEHYKSYVKGFNLIIFEVRRWLKVIYVKNESPVLKSPARLGFYLTKGEFYPN